MAIERDLFITSCKRASALNVAVVRCFICTHKYTILLLRAPAVVVSVIYLTIIENYVANIRLDAQSHSHNLTKVAVVRLTEASRLERVRNPHPTAFKIPKLIALRNFEFFIQFCLLFQFVQRNFNWKNI